jgi:hypothetical protein
MVSSGKKYEKEERKRGKMLNNKEERGNKRGNRS